MTDFLTAERFLQAEARLLDRRLFATLFRGEPADGVVEALRGYRNADGGFGHGLEPDKRCPASLPIDVEMAFQTLATVGAPDQDLLGPACDFLARTAADAHADGAVPLAFPVIEGYPRAEHWTEWTYEPGINPTAGLAALLYQLNFDHPWRTQAANYCWQQLESGNLPDETHALNELLNFLAHTPDRERATHHAPAVLNQLTASPLFQPLPKPGEYGLTPLTIAATANSPWRQTFDNTQIEAHLDHLAAQQQPDGGWPITWPPPTEASRLDWRGHITLQSLQTLTSYGRLKP